MTETLMAATVATPAGPLVVVTTTDAVVRAAAFGPATPLLARLAATRPGADVRQVAPEDLPSPVLDALEGYAAGDIGALDGVPVQQPGGAYFQSVWEAMRRIPPGTTVTYSRLSEMAARPTAVRAAGSACARNLVAPFVPCHRVVRTDGTLGGYAYGLEVKRRLLAHERGFLAQAVAVAPPPAVVAPAG